MGRLTIEETNDLIDAGILSTNALLELQDRGLVGTRRRRKEPLFVLNYNGVKVYPLLVFKGHGKGNKDSDTMVSIRNDFQLIINNYKENE